MELSTYIPGSLPLNRVLKAKYCVAVISEDRTVSISMSMQVGWADGPRGGFGFPHAGERGRDGEVSNPLACTQGCCSIPCPELGTASSSAHPLLSCLLGQMHSKVRSLSSPISNSQLSAPLHGEQALLYAEKQLDNLKKRRRLSIINMKP